MRLSPLPAGPVFTPAAAESVPRPPARWARWSTSPVARVDYGNASRVEAWHEAWLPAARSVTGARLPGVIFGGMSKGAAIEAARALAQQAETVTVDLADGSTRTVQVHPAIAVLRDAKLGAFWIAPLRTTVRSGGEWAEVPHSIDGAAFEGPAPLLAPAVVRSATREMVAIVGRDTVVAARRWDSAPHDSLSAAG